LRYHAEFPNYQNKFLFAIMDWGKAMAASYLSAAAGSRSYNNRTRGPHPVTDRQVYCPPVYPAMPAECLAEELKAPRPTNNSGNTPAVAEQVGFLDN
jgi:hypothetical protein